MKELDTIETTAFSEYENDIDTILKDVDKRSFILTVNKIESEYLEDQKRDIKTRKISRSLIYSLAAAIIVISIGIGTVLKLGVFSTQVDSELIFNQYYATYQVDFQNRSDEAVVQNLYLAFLAYEGKEYDKAIELFNKVSEGDATIIMAYFYKGISCIEISDYKQAIESFNKVLANKNNPYFAQSRWYSALTWIKLNNINSAKEHLEWLIKNDRYYGSKAKEILKKIS
jgi:tetratricopeptide (TPR) repeat protein